MTRSSSRRHPSAAPEAPAHRVCAIRGGTVRFAYRIVLDGIDLAVAPSDRLAVIGDNGSGKSTLLRVLAGDLPLSAGDLPLSAGEREVRLPGGLAMAEQRPQFPPGATIAEALDHLLADIRRIEAAVRDASEKLAAAEGDRQAELLDELSAAMDLFDARGGYQRDQRLDSALDQLSLGDVDRGRPVDALSGGERARLALAAAMSSEAELLLLDEPTNDLDDAGIAWLEERLSLHQGALVVVTHDRALLERFATDIVAIDEGALRRYGDGYAGYLAAREAERRRLLSEHEAWRSDLARSEALVAANSFRLDSMPRKQARAVFGHGAFRARGSDHGAMGRIRQAKERVARLHANPAPRPADPLRFAPPFAPAPAPEAEGDPGEAQLLLAADSVVLGTEGGGPRLVIDSLAVREGERWLVSGPNGAGKTTLLRVLAGETAPDRGAIWHRPGLRAAWLRQDLAAGLDGTLLDAFADATGAYRDDAADALLALGLFPSRDLDLMLPDLSVGQRRRFELAVAVSTPSDLLLLDEPTNHLAPDLVEQLEKALLDYPGTVITVTHDRRWREQAAEAGWARRLDVLPGGLVCAP